MDTREQTNSAHIAQATERGADNHQNDTVATAPSHMQRRERHRAIRQRMETVSRHKTVYV